MLDEDFHGHFCLDERLPTSATLYDMYYMLEMKRDKNVTETYKKKNKVLSGLKGIHGRTRTWCQQSNSHTWDALQIQSMNL